MVTPIRTGRSAEAAGQYAPSDLTGLARSYVGSEPGAAEAAAKDFYEALRRELDKNAQQRDEAETETKVNDRAFEAQKHLANPATVDPENVIDTES